MENKEFYRRTIKVGNSAGVLLPKSVLGAEVLVKVITTPLNVKRDTLKMLEPVSENLIGIFIISIEKRNIEILAVSNNLNKQIKNGNYKIDIVSFDKIKKAIKERSEIRKKLLSAKPILNSKLLEDFKKI